MPLYLTLNFNEPKGRPYRIYANDPLVGKFISTPKERGKATLSVMPCGNHDDPAVVTVTVQLWDPIDKKVVVWGTAKACPLCWELLKFISGKEELKELFADRP